MWCCKFIIDIILVLVILVSIKEANTSYHKENYSSDRNVVPEDQPNIEAEKNIIPFSGEHRSDPGILFLLSHEPSLNEDEVHAGLQLLGIPAGQQSSHLKENYRSGVLPALEGLARLLKDTLQEKPINGGGMAANQKQEDVRVPLEQLKNLITLASACSKHDVSRTFPSEEESRSVEQAISQSENPTRRNQKISAGLNLLGLPLGPQFVYERNDNHNGQDSDGIATPVISNVIRSMAKKLIGQMFFQ